MNDSMMFKYLLGKYCFRRWILLGTLVFLLGDLYFNFLGTLIILGLYLVIPRLYIWLFVKSLRGILGHALGGIYFVFLSEVTLPILFICNLLRLL